MKVLENKKFTIEQTKFDYINLIIQAAEYTPVAGLTFKEMSDRLSIISAAKKGIVKGKVTLEDKEFNDLIVCLDSVRWSFVDAKLVEFDKYVRSFNK